MKKYFIMAALAGLAAGLLTLPYRPPLLQPADRNLKEWLLDRIGFVCHYTRAVILESSRGQDAPAALRAQARAVWYRPSLSEDYFGIPPDNPRALAGRYESLGLADEAVLLVEHCLESGSPSAEDVSEAILTCSGLDAWDSVARIARRDAASGSSRGRYFLGKALLELGLFPEAEEHLRQAETGLEGCPDLYFQLGRACRSRGQTERAENYFRRTVELAPVFREGWEALAELLNSQGRDREAEIARAEAGKLRPALRFNRRFGNELLLLGGDPFPASIQGGAKFELALHCLSLPGKKRQVQPRIRLAGPRSAKMVLPPAVDLPESPCGVHLKVVLEVTVPDDIWPGKTQLTLGLQNESGGTVRLFGSREEYASLGSIDIQPRLTINPGDREKARIVFGPGGEDLGVGTILSGRSSISIPVSPETRTSALAVISCTRDTVPLADGVEIGRVEFRTADGASGAFPVRLGVETADADLGNWPSSVARHRPAAAFPSLPVGENPSPSEYQAVFRFGRPVFLEEIRLAYDHPSRGAWLIRNLFLLRE